MRCYDRPRTTQAREALEWAADHIGCPDDDDAIGVARKILRERLAQPEQEPVAWRTFDGEGGYDYRSYDDNENYAAEWAQRNPRHVDWVEALYTTPPRREWVGLTEEEVDECYYWKGRQWTTDELVRHVEAKLKEKNNG